MASDWTSVRIDDVEAIIGGSFRRARAALGVSAFGIQVIDLRPDEHRYPEHDLGGSAPYSRPSAVTPPV